ncbi:hypothetical protein G6F70_007397 [Rhizopus microsporus]|uniref:Neutral amino acid transporter n=2 Tax=Rhizopus TaxID=4842 RepID=A0A367JFX2_RHIAZ|nr:hypothetical protein G6F71_007382 [Rhizopus microsporus]RCH88872.1 neutral amino acid transporter [Rhizopus azygosporus]KAG1196501.1 hypothetical protein G6F70_007397 [Rhizopus microsporus]KAG1208236.1 hypothetical protein G6F69_007388 [Rhizopus microsporus]KAG1229516.1 hypothetical protein G6F67_007091 [Rhizopus microsporus]
MSQQNENDQPQRGMVDLSQIRSVSYEDPRSDYSSTVKVSTPPKTIHHARFANYDDMPNAIPRPETTRMNTTGQIKQRPKPSSRATSFISPARRKSMARTISSLSLYGSFAGERFDASFYQSRVSLASMSEGKRNSILSQRSSIKNMKQEESSIGETEPETEHDTPKASVGKAMFMFLKAFVGSGVLFLPKAFQNGGLALSIVLIIVIALICLFAFQRLVNTQLIVGGSYGDIGGILYGQWIRFIVLFFIVISQIGFVCSYFIFVSGNLVSVVDVLSNCTANIAQKYYIWFPLIILVPFALVRHIAKLSFAVILADILILFGLICVIYFAAYQLKNFGVGPNIAAVNPYNFALMIGTATFSFEGIGLIIPIVESMKRPDKFPIVLTLGMMIVTVIYVLIGTLSYLAYGDRIQAAVIYNFPPNNRLTIAVELLYSLAICLTSPFMLFPALKIIENGIFGRCRSGRVSILVKWSKNVYRVIISVACAAIAFGVGGDNLDKFVSLVGSVACVPLCFIFPGMFHFKVSKKMIDKVWDSLLIIFGIGIMVYTLYVTIDSFISPRGTGEALAPYCPA